MKLSLFASFAALSLSLNACSKHECDFKTDAEKAALEGYADMTEGAFNCGIEGVALGDGVISRTEACTIGAPGCAPKMIALHAAPATVKDVAARYKAYLEKAQWKLEEKPLKSKYMSGKDIEGVELKGTNGAKSVMVTVFPFGDDMVETRTYPGPGK